MLEVFNCVMFSGKIKGGNYVKNTNNIKHDLKNYNIKDYTTNDKKRHRPEMTPKINNNSKIR
jgi:hypothetical protein